MLIVSSRLAPARHIAALRFNGIKIETSKKIWIYYKDLSEHRANINICSSIIIFVKRKGKYRKGEHKNHDLSRSYGLAVFRTILCAQTFSYYIGTRLVYTTVLLMRCIMLHYFLEFVSFCFWINKESRWYWSLIHTTATWYQQV